jgi:hypothetical protein
MRPAHCIQLIPGLRERLLDRGLYLGVRPVPEPLLETLPEPLGLLLDPLLQPLGLLLGALRPGLSPLRMSRGVPMVFPAAKVRRELEPELEKGEGDLDVDVPVAVLGGDASPSSRGPR